MKRLILVLASGLLIVTQACSVNVSKEVKAAFAAKFPSATRVSWSKENDKSLEAEFKLDGKKVSALFSLNGAWLETEEDVKVELLPAAVKTTMDGQFQNATIKECEKVTKPDNSITYELEIKTSEGVKEVVLNTDGVLVKVELVKDED